jgi:uncharacterized protein (TIGR03084 family)
VPADLAKLCGDLLAETGTLESMLASLEEEGWHRPTPAPGWDIGDQVTHLAYYDERAALAIRQPDRFVAERAQGGDTQARSAPQRRRHLSGADRLSWLRRARRDFVAASLGVDPATRIPWYGPEMSVATAVTARIMETWAHGQDVADTLRVERIATGRLYHIAYLGSKTVANSYRAHGLPIPDAPVRVELTGPNGAAWTFGPAGVPDVVRGSALDFCLVVCQRRHLLDTDLELQGPVARGWMSIAQAFAGPPGGGRRPGQFGARGAPGRR